MDLARLYLIKRLSESLTDEEREILVGRDRELLEIKSDLDKIKRQGLFSRDFASNVAGNAVFDGFVWIVSKLIKRLK